MGNILCCCCSNDSNESDLLQPDLETKRRQQAEAAERRMQENAGRGVRDPNRLLEKQKRLEELERKAAAQGNTGGGLKDDDTEVRELEIRLKKLTEDQAPVFDTLRFSELVDLEMRLEKLRQPIDVGSLRINQVSSGKRTRIPIEINADDGCDLEKRLKELKRSSSSGSYPS